MDWGRAKTILILAFLILNLFLGYQLLQTRLENNASYTDIDQTKYTLTQLIKINKIDVKPRLPEDVPQLSDIIVEQKEKPITNQQLAKPFRTNASVVTTRALMLALDGEVAHADDYVLDTASRESTAYTLYQNYNARPLFNSMLKLSIVEGEVKSYSQSYVTVVDKGKKTDPIMSASRALQFLIENYLQPYSEVTNIDLGYRGHSFGTQQQIVSPTWRFVLADGTQYFVDAVHGDVDVVEKES
jgi:regulatory protein YycI of two-component signal transduction system YycFG